MAFQSQDSGADAQDMSNNDIAKLLFARSAALSTGVLYIYSRSGTRRIELRQGVINALDAGPSAPARPEAQLRYLLRLRAPADFHPGSVFSSFRVITPFHPAPSIRNHVEAQNLLPDAFRRRLGAQRLSVAIPPHPSCVGWDEKPLLAFISQPRSWAEIEDRNFCAAARALKFVAFLDALGALTLYAPAMSPMSEALALLGLTPGASQDQIKSAYRRLARELHPDVHPHASAAERSALATRFAAIHAAYRKLAS